uniref:Uncharacterized protein n=1 Tax=Sus scrofa TaxID=9823 RepID=A0A8D1Z363_PIG
DDVDSSVCHRTGDVNWCSHYRRQCGGSSQERKIELPCDPAVPLLGVCPDKTIILKDTCTFMFIAALFTIAKAWKQPKCPLTDQRIKKMWYIPMGCYSGRKKKK